MPSRRARWPGASAHKWRGTSPERASVLPVARVLALGAGLPHVERLLGLAVERVPELLDPVLSEHALVHVHPNRRDRNALRVGAVLEDVMDRRQFLGLDDRLHLLGRDRVERLVPERRPAVEVEDRVHDVRVVDEVVREPRGLGSPAAGSCPGGEGNPLCQNLPCRTGRASRGVPPPKTIRPSPKKTPPSCRYWFPRLAARFGQVGSAGSLGGFRGIDDVTKCAGHPDPVRGLEGRRRLEILDDVPTSTCQTSCSETSAGR